MSTVPQPGLPFVSEYLLDARAEDDIDWGIWHVRVSYRGHGLWAVGHGPYVYSSALDPAVEPSPSNRDDDFRAATRFPLDEALSIASQVLPTLMINGRTAADAV